MLLSELAGLFERDLHRLAGEIGSFPDEESVWRVLPGVVNPAGNLGLHIEGNLREFVGRVLGEVAYERRRAEEFSARGVSREELVFRLHAVRDLVSEVLRNLPTDRLDALYPMQVLGHPMTTRYFLLHLLAHLSWHLGQVNYLRRIIAEAENIKTS